MVSNSELTIKTSFQHFASPIGFHFDVSPLGTFQEPTQGPVGSSSNPTHPENRDVDSLTILDDFVIRICINPTLDLLAVLTTMMDRLRVDRT